MTEMMAFMLQGSYLDVRNSHFQEKLHRGSTPHRETQQALDSCPWDRMPAMPTEQFGGLIRTWVEGLWPIDQLPKAL